MNNNIQEKSEVLRSSLIAQVEELRMLYLTSDCTVSTYEKQYKILKEVPFGNFKEAKRRIGNLRQSERTRQIRVGNKWQRLCEGYEQIFGEPIPAHLQR